MIRLDIGPRVFKTLTRLGTEITTKAEQKLREVQTHFGDPHRHSGLGLRKLGRRSYEIRVWLQWRIVLLHDHDRLTA